MWTLADSMLRKQWAAARDEDGGRPAETGKPVAVPAHATGHYGEIYARRKAATTPRIAATAHLGKTVNAKGNEVIHPDKWTPGRVHADAARYMFKALVKDLRVQWRLAVQGGGKGVTKSAPVDWPSSQRTQIAALPSE
jgi:hypothetical protein